MKQMHLVWALLCASCGGDPFSAESAASDGAILDSGAPSIVRSSDDAGRGGTSSGGSGGEDVAGGAGGSVAGTGGIGGALDEDAGVAGGAGGSDEGGAGAGGFGGGGGGGGGGGIGGVGGSNTGGAGGAGCPLVTHETGLGQTWQDCVPLETYNSTQAVAACTAWWCDSQGGCVSDPPANVCYTAYACGEIALLSGNDAGTYTAWSRFNGSVWLTDALGGGCIWAATWR